jgi:hypothetical protein
VVDRFKAKNLPDPLYVYRQHRSSNSKVVNVKRAIGHELARELARERRDSGSDVLDRGDAPGFDALVARLSEPYLKDPAWLYRDFAGRFLWAGHPAWAIRNAWTAIRTTPSDLRNYRALAYCLRKGLFTRGPWR